MAAKRYRCLQAGLPCDDPLLLRELNNAERTSISPNHPIRMTVGCSLYLSYDCDTRDESKSARVGDADRVTRECKEVVDTGMSRPDELSRR
jgi:hypothetical protein